VFRECARRARALVRNNSKEKSRPSETRRNLREQRWLVGAVHLKRCIATKMDGTIFSAGRVGIPERGQVHRQFRHGARAWDRRMQSADRPTAPSLCLSFAAIPSPSSMSPAVRTYVQGMRSLSSLFGARLWHGPLPRGSIGIAALPLPHVARAAMPAPVCVQWDWWGAALPYRPCPRHRRTTNGRRTNEQTNE